MTDFIMRGFNTNTSQYVLWPSPTTPDFAGTLSGVVPPGLLNDIVIYRRVESAGGGGGGGGSLDTYATFSDLDTFLTGMSAAENDLAGLLNANSELMGVYKRDQLGRSRPQGLIDLRDATGVFSIGNSPTDDIQFVGGPTSATFNSQYGMLMPQNGGTRYGVYFNFMGTYRPQMRMRMRMFIERTGSASSVFGTEFAFGVFHETTLPATNGLVTQYQAVSGSFRPRIMTLSTSIDTAPATLTVGSVIPIPGPGLAYDVGHHQADERDGGTNRIRSVINTVENQPDGTGNVESLGTSRVFSNAYVPGGTTSRLFAQFIDNGTQTAFRFYIRSLEVLDDEVPV